MHLIMFPGDSALPSLSPFCMKAVCLLEMAGEAWQPEYTTDVSTMPLGKLPVLRFGDQLIPDSSNIEDFLTARGANFYPGLSQGEICEAHALVRMVEYSLVLGMAHDRWLDENVWPKARDMFFAGVPDEIKEVVAPQAQESVRAGLMSQGIARFSPQDRQARFDKDLAAIDSKLAKNDFLFGDVPSGADAAIAPTLDMILRLPAKTDLRTAVAENAPLVAYVARVREAIYPEPYRAAAVTSAAE